MSDAIEVELGGDDHPRPSPGGIGGGRAAWLIVGLGLGFALTLLFSNSIGREPGAGGDTTTTTASPALGVGAAIPDFPDGLNVLVSPGEGRALEVLTWPLRGEPVYRSIPLGDIDLAGTAHFDASGQFLAATTSTPDGLILRSGRPNTFGVVATGVTGFAWHDGDPADLAWSVMEDDELQIWVSEDLGPGELAVRGIGLGSLLAAFGDWGFVTVEVSDGPSGSISHIIAPTGEEIRVVEGYVIASNNDGWLAIQEGQGVLVLTHVRSEEQARVDPGMGIVVGASIDPTADRIAVTGLTGMAVVDLESLERDSYPIRAGSDSIAWSSDGRFVLVSTFRGVLVVDTETGEISSILDSETTRSVAATPIAGS